MRLIDADALIELIDDDIAAYKDGYSKDFELPTYPYGSLCALRMVREYIKALPTVEPPLFKATKEAKRRIVNAFMGQKDGGEK